jgi:hypothetical protein
VLSVSVVRGFRVVIRVLFSLLTFYVSLVEFASMQSSVRVSPVPHLVSHRYRPRKRRSTSVYRYQRQPAPCLTLDKPSTFLVSSEGGYTSRHHSSLPSLIYSGFSMILIRKKRGGFPATGGNRFCERGGVSGTYAGRGFLLSATRLLAWKWRDGSCLSFAWFNIDISSRRVGCSTGC